MNQIKVFETPKHSIQTNIKCRIFIKFYIVLTIQIYIQHNDEGFTKTHC